MGNMRATAVVVWATSFTRINLPPNSCPSFHSIPCIPSPAVLRTKRLLMDLTDEFPNVLYHASFPSICFSFHSYSTRCLYDNTSPRPVVHVRALSGNKRHKITSVISSAYLLLNSNDYCAGLTTHELLHQPCSLRKSRPAHFLLND